MFERQKTIESISTILGGFAILIVKGTYYVLAIIALYKYINS